MHRGVITSCPLKLPSWALPVPSCSMFSHFMLNMYTIPFKESSITTSNDSEVTNFCYIEHPFTTSSFLCMVSTCYKQNPVFLTMTMRTLIGSQSKYQNKNVDYSHLKNGKRDLYVYLTMKNMMACCCLRTAELVPQIYYG